MATVTEEIEDTRVIPPSGHYGASPFAFVATGVVFILALGIAFLFLMAIGSAVLGYQDFQAFFAGVEAERERLADEIFTLAQFSENPVTEDEAMRQAIEQTQGYTPLRDGRPIDYMYMIRWSIALFIASFVLVFPTRWLFRTYGIQSVNISDDGLEIRKFPFYKYFVSWDGVLDISVKESSSLFAVMSDSLQKITIYTMDRSIDIEAMTLAHNQEVSDRLRIFGDSLEERVLDFGYGAQLAVIWRRVKRSKVGVFGFLVVIFFVGVSIFAASLVIISPINTVQAQLQPRTLFGFHNPNFPSVANRNQAPNSTYWFGTDSNGRDIFSRLLFGAFYSILIGFISTLISSVIGGFVGAASGYLGGTIDNIIQRVTEVLNSMPGLPILLLVSAAFTPIFNRINIEGAYYLVVFSLFAFISWGGLARIVRSEVLALKNSEFIHAEIVLGATHYRIIRKHILPNAMSTIIISFTLSVAGAITGVASLSFLGFGSQSTLVWGKDLSDAITNIPTQHWWGPTYISLMLFLLVLGFNLMGDALRDAMDPTLK